LAIGVLKKDVGKAVSVEVAGSDCLPSRPCVNAHCPTADEISSVHFPDGGLAVRVLPENVGMAIAVEIARCDLGPTRSRVGGDEIPAYLDGRGGGVSWAPESTNLEPSILGKPREG
jgi:hypothetical protein